MHCFINMTLISNIYKQECSRMFKFENNLIWFEESYIIKHIYDRLGKLHDITHVLVRQRLDP